MVTTMATLTINGLVIEQGYSKTEWNRLEEDDPNLWEFLLSDILEGAIELNPDMNYWLIWESGVPYIAEAGLK